MKMLLKPFAKVKHSKPFIRNIPFSNNNRFYKQGSIEENALESLYKTYAKYVIFFLFFGLMF